jgi:hypothetical protein
VLGRDDLLTCLDHVGLEVRDRRVKDELVEMLARARIGGLIATLFKR